LRAQGDGAAMQIGDQKDGPGIGGHAIEQSLRNQPVALEHHQWVC
jgi:hypothetical protein